ncbi:MAG: oligosaccharide flippase family protein [Promethearchaeota archaeon]
MENTQNDKAIKKMAKDHKILAVNSIFSFFHSYSGFIFSILSSVLIARMISQDLWGYILLSLSSVNIFALILSFLPPSLGLSLNYYIPRYRALNQSNTLKSFVKYTLLIRVIFSILIFSLSIFLFYFWTDLFNINLESYSHLFLIFSPLILIFGLDKILNDIIRAFNMFKMVFYLLILKNLLYIGGLFIYFLVFNTFTAEVIAVINLISNFIPFLCNIIIVFVVFKSRLKKTQDKEMTLRQAAIKMFSYGIPLSFKDFADGFYKQLKVQLVGIFASPEVVLGYSIGNNYNNVSFEAVISLGKPLTIAFSSLYAKEKKEEISKIYRVSYFYSVFLILLISGLLFFVADFFLFIVYGESYLEYSLILKLMVIAIIFNVQGSFFFSLMRASNKVKYLFPISIAVISVRLSMFLIGLVFFGIIGAIMIGIFFANILIFLFLLGLTIKFFDLRLNLFKVFMQYIIFFISLIIPIVLNLLILDNVKLLILGSLNLLVLRTFDIFGILIFLFCFFIFNLIFQIFTRKDIDYLIAFFSKDNKVHKLIRKFLGFFKRFMRE